MEEHVTIPCGELTLEGRFCTGKGEKGVVITHPHPLYGGDMDNPVVVTIKNAYIRRGYSTLRFNFRGVGASRGGYDNGVGEQTDLQAAITFLETAGIRHIDLAGYSFGSWIIARLSPPPDGLNRVLMVSPPVTMMDFPGMGRPLLPTRVITGDRDEFAPPGAIGALFDESGTAGVVTVIRDADHFFSGCMKELESSIFDAID